MVLIEHKGKSPRVHETAYIAPNAVLSGDVRIGAGVCILFGAVVSSEGGPVFVGENSIVMEHAVLRGTPRHRLTVGPRNLIGPHAYLSGCETAADVFVAAGVKVYNGALICARSEVRINGVVHINTVLPADSTVPIGWVAVGNPVRILSHTEHEEIWSIQKELDFPSTVFGLTRARPGETIMPELTARYSLALQEHRNDRTVM